MVSPNRSLVAGWRVTPPGFHVSTPSLSSETGREIDAIIEGPAKIWKQGFYQCSWDVLSVRSDESDDESDECCSLADSYDEEDTLHLPADRLSAHQRDRREHPLAREVASRAA